MSDRDRHIDYIELPAADMDATKAFYGAAFGWMFTDYGPDYAAFQGAGIDGGFTTAAPASTDGALVVLYADDLEATLATVEGAGAAITEPIFEFPGGRRFHFSDPGGNVLAVWGDPVGGG